MNTTVNSLESHIVENAANTFTNFVQNVKNTKDSSNVIH